MNTQETVTPSSGCVWTDIEMKHPTQERLKSEVAMAIQDIMEVFELKQADIVKMTGLDQSSVSNMLRGRVSKVGLAALFDAYTSLGGTIDMEFTSPESLPVRDRAAR